MEWGRNIQWQKECGLQTHFFMKEQEYQETLKAVYQNFEHVIGHSSGVWESNLANTEGPNK